MNRQNLTESAGEVLKIQASAIKARFSRKYFNIPMKKIVFGLNNVVPNTKNKMYNLLT